MSVVTAGLIGIASVEAYLVQEALREAIKISFGDGDASASVERAWTHYLALGEALRATGIEPPQSPEGT